MQASMSRIDSSPERMCARCGEPLQDEPVRRGRPRTICLDCVITLLHLKLASKLDRKVCEHCHTEFEGKGRFCRPACRWRSAHAERKAQPEYYKLGESWERVCVECGGLIPGSRSRKFCSTRCMRRHRRTATAPSLRAASAPTALTAPSGTFGPHAEHAA